jgi:hypothetical protein
MEVSAGIDWISATYPYDYDRNGLAMVYRNDIENKVETAARNGYTRAWRVGSGAIIQKNPERPDMGIHVTYSAKAIARACAMDNGSQKDLLDFLMIGGKITRLDICVDAIDSGIIIEELYNQAKKGKVKTRSRSISHINSAIINQEGNGASTMYIGSQKKRKKLLRVYDKGEQLGLKIDLKRFELEMHGDISNNAAGHLVDKKEAAYPPYIKGMIKGFADFTDTDAGKVFDAKGIKIAVPQYKKSDTAAWLVNVVAPTLARESFLDYSVLQSFLDRFQSEFEILQEKQ